MKQLREKRKQIQAKRLAILFEIDQLKATYNACKDSVERETLKSRISVLGEQLIGTVAVNIKDHAPKNKNETESWNGITIEEYIDYKALKMSDQQIATKKGVGIGKLMYWKNRNDIRAKRLPKGE